MKKTLRCIIYARSASEERTDGLPSACDAQVSLFLKLIETMNDHGWLHVGTCQDPKALGTRLSRPGLNELLRAIRRGFGDVVVVSRLDRFSRVKEHLLGIEAFIKAHGASIASCSEPHPLSRLGIGMLNYHSNFQKRSDRP